MQIREFFRVNTIRDCFFQKFLSLELRREFVYTRFSQIRIYQIKDKLFSNDKTFWKNREFA
jgi:hypothetical protein